MKKIILLLILTIVLFIAGCDLGNQSNTETASSSNTGEGNDVLYVIEITSEGFSPSPLTVTQGSTVTWINKDANEHWPASAMHPTHAIYPESGGCIGSKFDACKGLKEGESWSFTFNEKGTWNYHDHFDVSKFGKIIVE
ncbi:MAG: hypothetical protein QT11_C0001G0653 [archaeon GW2011_AR20]|nr:MAG: hypothetical protein QT11_C0001G0653 [archaeon GW2011_AR20]MBS3160924.1 hypothetical protein [Candidatus Woesearchaeota archaeon]